MSLVETRTYGAAPIIKGELEIPGWDEFMCYLYLPVFMGYDKSPVVRLPERIAFLEPIVRRALDEDYRRYVYVTAKRGFATPGDPLNRPGWHTDGFLSEDINWIWTDAYPTRFAIQEFEDIEYDHIRSIEQFGEQVDAACLASIDPWPIQTFPEKTLLKLDAFVVHQTPTVPPPGGMRSFFKISLSDQVYNLRGNSHNYLFDYRWKMWDREELRNDPAYAGGDAGPQLSAFST